MSCWTPEQAIKVIEAAGWAIAGLIVLWFVGIPFLQAILGVTDE
jgi:hypothetical protein